MTKEQIEQKALGVYPEIYALNPDKDLNIPERNAYIKALQEIEKLPKIKGWIARDKMVDSFWGCGLIFHNKKPIRTDNVWSSNTIAMHLKNDMFPEITWESEPVEVELLIRKL